MEALVRGVRDRCGKRQVLVRRDGARLPQRGRGDALRRCELEADEAGVEAMHGGAAKDAALVVEEIAVGGVGAEQLRHLLDEPRRTVSISSSLVTTCAACSSAPCCSMPTLVLGQQARGAQGGADLVLDRADERPARSARARRRATPARLQCLPRSSRRCRRRAARGAAPRARRARSPPGRARPARGARSRRSRCSRPSASVSADAERSRSSASAASQAIACSSESSSAVNARFASVDATDEHADHALLGDHRDPAAALALRPAPRGAG